MYISRRDFMKATAFAAGTVTVGDSASSSVLGANDRINLAVIGCGHHGTGWVEAIVGRRESWNFRIVAVCDVYRKRVTRAKALCQGEAEGYFDYRKVLERKDVDAVMVVTPDHWHAKMAIDALEAGKHVHLEKPMSRTVEQALAVRDAARRSPQILNVGADYASQDQFWEAREAIQAGRIGKVIWAQASFNRNARICAFNDEPFIPDPAASPRAAGENYIDWDMWLGHQWGLAPKIPWNPEHFFRFRKYWAYSGGVATDLMYHKLAPLLLAIAGPDGEYPLRVSSSGGLYVEKDGREIPDTHIMTIDYPGEHTILLVSTLCNDTQLVDRIYGKYGTLDLDVERNGDPVLRANGDFSPEFEKANHGYKEVTIPHGPRDTELANTLAAIRGHATVHCNANLGAATMVAIKMGVESYRQRKTLSWDQQNERVVS
jgi:predicted dehydrogenase